MNLEIVTLGASELVDGVLVSEGSDKIEGAGDDISEPVGSLVQMSQLGVYAAPYPADDAGHVEAVVANGCGGRDAVCIGAMDTRSAGVIGALQPGDTTVATTHPKSKAQLQCKGEKNQVVLYVHDSDDESMVVQLDGKANQIVISGFGMSFVMSKADGITLTNGEARISMSGPNIYLQGVVSAGAGSAPVPVHSGLGAGATSVPTPGLFALL
jgi:hypothetical protein